MLSSTFHRSIVGTCLDRCWGRMPVVIAVACFALLVAVRADSAEGDQPDTPARFKTRATQAKPQAAQAKPQAATPQTTVGAAAVRKRPPATPAPSKAAAAKSLEVEELGGSDLTAYDRLPPTTMVPLRATFFPGDADKNTIPVLLLHAQKGSRKDFSGLAPYLASKGYAVLVPDLRGHGDSTTKYEMKSGKRREVELDAAKLHPADFTDMARFDMAALRRFLIRKNNEELLNFNKLVIVGARMGASIAIDWAAYDWSLPSYPGVKQSRDVKALVLLSPTWTHPGLRTTQSLNHPAIKARLGILIAVGAADSKAAGDARRLHSKLKAFREDVSKLRPAEQRERSTLWFAPLDTKLQGSKMLNVRALKLPARIASFIDVRVANDRSRDAAWVKHATPQ